LTCLLQIACTTYTRDDGTSVDFAYDAPRDAIVGMWHRKGDYMNGDVRWSLLFRKNGTGVSRISSKTKLITQEDFTWEFLENAGDWRYLAYWKNGGTFNPHQRTIIGITSDKRHILTSTEAPWQVEYLRYVYDRVD
jgi:hypothetical protein